MATGWKDEREEKRANDRSARLKAALRANLSKRKDQARKLTDTEEG